MEAFFRATDLFMLHQQWATLKNTLGYTININTDVFDYQQEQVFVAR